MSTGLRAGTNNDGYLQVNGTDVLTALSSGKLGIGTSTPTADIHLETSAYPTLKIQNTSSASGFPVLQLIDNRTNGVSFNIENGRDAGSLNFRDNTSTADRLTITSAGLVRVPDGGKFVAGSGDDLQIYHDGGNSYIDDTGTGRLNIRGNTGVSLRNYSDSEQFINCYTNGVVEIFHDNIKKLETTSTGVTVTGSITQTTEYPSIRPTLDLNFAATKTLDRRITFTRDGQGTYVGEDGLVKYASNNVPRFNHNPTTGESLGLLIEEARTNQILYSLLTTDNWTANGSTLSNNTTETTAPDGTNTAGKWVPNSGTTGWCSIYNKSTISVTSGTAYTFSVWAKATHSDYTVFRMTGDVRDGGGTNFNVLFTLSGDGSVDIDGHAEDGDADSASIEKYPNGWYRCIVTQTADATTTEEPGFSAGANGDGTKGFYTWGYQVEAGAFATSYIPTSGSTVTRAVDTAIIRGTNFTDWYNSSASTLFVEGKLSGTTSTGQYPFVAFEVESNNNRNSSFAITRRSGSGVRAVNYDSSGTQDLDITSSAWDGGSFKKFAYALDDSGSSSVLVDDGTVIGTDSSYATTSLSSVDILRFADHNSGGMTNFNVTIKSFKYYNKRLPNAQLQGLTQQ